MKARLIQRAKDVEGLLGILFPEGVCGLIVSFVHFSHVQVCARFPNQPDSIAVDLEMNTIERKGCIFEFDHVFVDSSDENVCARTMAPLLKELRNSFDSLMTTM